MIALDYQFQNLSLADLRSTVLLSKVGNFRQTAEQCGISQPSLSVQIRKVEQALGATLFERSNRRFIITDAGRALLPKLEELLRISLDLQDLAKQQQRGILSGPLTLGVIPTVGPYLLPKLLPRLRAKYPELQLFVHEMVTQELEEAIDGGTIDCGIQAIPASHTGLSALELMKDDFLLMAPLEHPLLQHPSLALASLDPAQLVLLAEGHCLRDQALALCKASGGQCSKVVAGSLELLRTLVAAGHGYSLMPRLAAENSGFANPLLGFAEFSDPVPSRTLGLVFRKTTYRIDEFKAFAEVAATCKF